MISLLIAISAGVDMVGEKARLVIVLTVLALGVAAGIAFGRLIERKRSAKNPAES